MLGYFHYCHVLKFMSKYSVPDCMNVNALNCDIKCHNFFFNIINLKLKSINIKHFHLSHHNDKTPEENNRRMNISKRQSTEINHSAAGWVLLIRQVGQSSIGGLFLSIGEHRTCVYLGNPCTIPLYSGSRLDVTFIAADYIT